MPATLKTLDDGSERHDGSKEIASVSNSKQERSSSTESGLFAAVTCIHAICLGAAYQYDKAPFTTIGATCLSYGYFLIHSWQKNRLPSNQQIDVNLSFFLASQLFLAYFSSYDPGKAPHGDSPLSASASFCQTNKNVILYYGEIFANVDESSPDIDIAKGLEMMELLCLCTWILALVASLTVEKERIFASWARRLVFSLLALSYVFLHGIMAGLNGVSHRFYLAAYFFVALFFEASLGIDAHSIMCLFAGYTFFGAGFSKLINSEFTWHDGQALCRYIGEDFQHEFWGTFCSTMAPVSLFFEIFSPTLLLPMFGFVGKAVYVFLALTFHLAIAILMYPRYTSQSCAYSLLFRTNPSKPKGRILFAALCCVLILTSAFRLDNWPLSSIPMYSTNLPKGFGSTIEEALRTARIVHESKCISDFNHPGSSLYITMEGGTCSSVWSVAKKLGNSKLTKLILIRGLASALVCQESFECASKNYFFDKFSRAVHDECEMDVITYSLILHSKPPHLVPVYSWNSPRQARVPAGDERPADQMHDESTAAKEQQHGVSLES